MLDALLDGVARRLRGASVVGHTVVLRLRFDDFTRVTRSSTLAAPTADTEPLREALRRLLADAQPMIDARGLTLVGLAVANLSDADAVQLPPAVRRWNRRRPRPRARRGAGPLRRPVDRARRPARPRPRVVDAGAALRRVIPEHGPTGSRPWGGGGAGQARPAGP